MPMCATIRVVNAMRDFAALDAVCREARDAGVSVHVLHRAGDSEAIRRLIPQDCELIRMVEMADGGCDFPGLDDDADIIFLPCVDGIDWADLQRRGPLEHPHCIQPLVATMPGLSRDHYVSSPVDWFGWQARGVLARRILQEPSVWEANGIELIEAIQRWPDPPHWQSIALPAPGDGAYPVSDSPRITMSSSVLVVISFFGCEEWLHACLTSIHQQTRPPENIVVIDDCSPSLPLKYLEPFPNVTLLSTSRNAGPEKILNNIIHATDYDAYMVQDADDWSSHDRLELSLRAMEQTGAEMAGCPEFRVDLPRKALKVYAYPPDVNYAMSQRVTHHLLHGSSIISRALAVRIGGFDEQLKVCADTDFCFRAWHAGQIVNLSSVCFYRRVRAGSLTTDDKTGPQSAVRSIEWTYINLRGMRNLEKARAGQVPKVTVKQKEPVEFNYHRGPKLRLCGDGSSEGKTVLTRIVGM